MTMKIILMFAVVAMIWEVECTPTYCDRNKGGKEYLCAKENYHADTVTVQNRAGTAVSFKAGLWLSRCGQTLMNYGDSCYSLGPGQSVTISFSEVGPGMCNQMYIYDCKINNNGADCLDAVIAHPNYH